MNTDSRKKLFVPLAYWLLLLLAGFLLLATYHGSGNGDGTAHDGASTVAENGSGNTADPTADGHGANSASSQDTPAQAATPLPQTALPATAATPPNATPQNAPDEFKQSPDDLTPTLARKPPRKQPPVHSQSKIITLEEAKSGFFGVKVPAQERAIFLLDVSGSMYAPTADGLTRLEMMKRIFAAELNRLHQETKNERLKSRSGSYIFCTFSDTLKRYPPNKIYHYASSADLRAALNDIKTIDQDAGGGTSMQQAFNTLKQIINRDVPCDSLYFLTDGEPTDCQPQELLNWLRTHMPNLRINAFAFAHNCPLMKDIARQHHGTHREIR